MQRRTFLHEGEVFRLPRTPPPPITPDAFAVCPLAVVQGACPLQIVWQQALYQLALQQAQEVARPSIQERNLLAVWN